MTPNPQDSAVALEVERAIREALDAGPTPGPWLSAGATVYSLTEDRARSGPVNRFSAGFQSARQPWEAQANELISNARLVVACNPEAMRTLLAELDRLRASQSDGTSGGWRPIETAPKDGTGFLLTNGKDVSQGWWVHEEPYIREQRDVAGVYIDQQEHEGFDGWMDCDGGMQPDPTFWMPLPVAPNQGENHVG